MLAERVAAAKFPKVTASRAAALAYYRKHLGLFTVPTQAKIGDIVVKSKISAKCAARIRGGEPFGVTARQFTFDPELKASSGQLGWIALDSLPAPLKAAVAKLRAGQLSRPVQAETAGTCSKCMAAGRRRPTASTAREAPSRGSSRVRSGPRPWRSGSSVSAPGRRSSPRRSPVPPGAGSRYTPGGPSIGSRPCEPSPSDSSSWHSSFWPSGWQVAARTSTSATSPGPGTRRRSSGSRLSWPGWCSSAASRPPSWQARPGGRPQGPGRGAPEDRTSRLRQAEAALPASSPVLAASGGSAGEGGGPVSGERLETRDRPTAPPPRRRSRRGPRARPGRPAGHVRRTGRRAAARSFAGRRWRFLMVAPVERT